MKEYLNIDELAEYLGIDTETVKGFFPPPPSFNLGKFEKYKKSDVDRWVDELNNEQSEQKVVLAETQRDKAKAMMREKKYEEAGKMIREAILFNPKDPDSHFIYGYTLVKLENFKEAELELRKGLKLNPKADWRDEAAFQIKECQKKLGTYFGDRE